MQTIGSIVGEAGVANGTWRLAGWLGCVLAAEWDLRR
jgi:hypothetical protein